MSISMETISTGVTNLVINALKSRGISRYPDIDDPLKGAGIDSMSTVALLLALEKQFSLTIPDDLITVGNFYSIRSIIGLVAKVSRNANHA